MTLIGIVLMIWSVTKVTSVIHKIDAHEGWIFLFNGFGVVGCGLMIFAAYEAIKDCYEPPEDHHG